MARLKAALPESSPLPELPANGPWQQFHDPLKRFQEVLESVGGQVIRAVDVEHASQQLNQNEFWRKATMRCSVVPGLGDSTFDLDSIDDPHMLERVDFAVLKGEFAVAENGAVWVTDATVRHRVLYFIPQHLALAIPTASIVHNLHEAYDRIPRHSMAFSAFISGPSKTADIEQSLVIGAHGARSLNVILIDSWSSV